eukprot:TRINITY_DN51602_c0_g1_i1.p1 TRINITY_DN51602_c0_g1~~TRINITY_DN51602_c0_g1_i1.p1  ORF type:complete len:291 (+),score=61.26 TRINITY_DN51602_c0_g1_i1:142-1014(+)
MCIRDSLKTGANHSAGGNKSKAAKREMPLCSYGDACTRRDCIYRHPPRSKTRAEAPAAAAEAPVCMAFVAGCCTFGVGCFNKHPPAEEVASLKAHLANTLCHFGDQCTNGVCLHAHPGPTLREADDGNMYTRSEFSEYYGGLSEWVAAGPAPAAAPVRAPLEITPSVDLDAPVAVPEWQQWQDLDNVGVCSSHSFFALGGENVTAPAQEVGSFAAVARASAAAPTPVGIVREAEATALGTMKVPQHVWVDSVQRNPESFQVADPMERYVCLLYTSPSPRDRTRSRMPSSA